MTNTNPVTGIRYGVIAGNSLDATVFDDLFYSGTNLSEQEAMAELRLEVTAEADAIEEECGIAVAERDAGMPNRDREALFDRLVQEAYERKGYSDRDDFIEREIERRYEHLGIEEPTIEGEEDGVKYRISWLGGAPLVWIIEGPIGYADRLCSPCVPNAADLDSGFYLHDELDTLTGNFVEGTSSDDLDSGFECYVVPRDWLPNEENT